MVACTQLESPEDFFGNDGGGVTVSSPNRPRSAEGAPSRPSSVAGCSPIDVRPALTIGEPGQAVELDEDGTWNCQNNYTLAAPVFVRPGATLTIGPDTRVLSEQGVFILVERGARLVAQGTRNGPVVLTSARAVGQRAPADWRGLVLTGNAPSHVTNTAVADTVSDARAFFGGGPNGEDDHDCGVLRYVRIEFAGGNTDEEATPSAALSLAGCGTGTEIDHVQIHRASDGLGLLGGTVAVRHTVVSNNGFGDAVEWTGGYTGQMQYVVAQSAGAAASFKGSNSDSEPSLQPVSHPVIYNATAVGVRSQIPSGSHVGLLLEFGSAATMKNSIITNFDDAAIDLRSAPTVASISPNEISHILLHQNGTGGSSHLTAAAGRLSGPSLRDRDPGLGAATRREEPNFQPTEPSVMTDIVITPAGFDPAASFRGAVPFEGDDWTVDWTEYPLD